MGEIPTQHARLALFWSVLGSIGTVALFPYLLEINPGLLDQSPLSLPAMIAAQTIQIGLTLFLGGWIALKAGASIGLDTPIARSWVYKTEPRGFDRSRVLLAMCLGLGLGLTGILLDSYVFMPLLPEARVPVELSVPRWKALLGSFYGGITEELLTRLIVVTLIAWLLARVLARGKEQPPNTVFHVAIVAAALLFALGHLPTAGAIWELTPMVILRVLVLNMYGAIPFGYLYWRWGLEYAMIAHFFADLGLHVVAGT